MARQGAAVSGFPLWPKVAGEGAKRVLVQAYKGVAGDTQIAEGMVLHKNDDAYTSEAHAVLREIAPLKL